MTGFTPRHLPRKAAPALAATLAPSSLALASSHREAPFITTAPTVDGTDFCMVRSHETGRADCVSLIANCQPLQDANGGPNCFAPDPNALHEIHVDNNGDAKEDPTFQFRFNNTLAASGNGVTLPIGGKSVATALIQAGQIVNPSDGTTFAKPLDTIGLKTIPHCASHAGLHICTVNIPC